MEIKTSADEQLRQIKLSFRLKMNGVAAQSMREKGLDYHVNWGISLPELKDMANGIGKNYSLAIALWKENVRECKILATMVMPADKMLPEVADIWMEQTTNIELAEQAALNLYQHLPYAAEKAYQWIASGEDLRQICGYHVLSRLFMRHRHPNERGINEYLDHAQAAIQGGSAGVKKAAMASMMRFAELGLVYERMARSVFSKLGMAF